MTPDVINVKTGSNYELIVTFADQACRRFSMLPYLEYPAYGTLKEPARFNQAHVENGTVVWNEDTDISPDTLYLAGEPVPAQQ
jgi:hypothetical protein